jgi:hypothetical protein
MEPMEPEDIMVLEQLWYGNHLEPNEVVRAKKLIERFQISLKWR